MVIFYATVDFKIKLFNQISNTALIEILIETKLSYTATGPIQVVFLQNYKKNIEIYFNMFFMLIFYFYQILYFISLKKWSFSMLH